MNFFREATFFRTHLCILLAGKDCLLSLVFLLAFSQRIFLDFSTMPPYESSSSLYDSSSSPNALFFAYKAFFYPHYGFRLPPSIHNASSLHLAYSARQRKLDVS